LNYNVTKIPALQAAEVLCRLPSGKQAKSVTLYSPDFADSRTEPLKNGSSQASFAVPVKTYTIAVVSW